MCNYIIVYFTRDLIKEIHILKFTFYCLILDLGMLVVDQHSLVCNTFRYLHYITILYRKARQL